jgi:hypothetical protein
MKRRAMPISPRGANPDFPGRVTRIERLRRDLATVRFRADHPREGDIPILLGAIGQLTAMVEFARSDPYCRDLIDELRALLAALFDIHSGRSVDWLTPKAKPNAPPLDITTAMFHGWCAAVMQFLMKAGFKKEAAARFIVEEGGLRRELPKRTNPAPPWRTVANWRQRVIGPSDPARDDEKDEKVACEAMLAGPCSGDAAGDKRCPTSKIYLTPEVN